METVVERPFIPNDVRFAPDETRAMIITGCNMSGKSSYSRMVALLVIMTQIGCRIPCTYAKIGVVDYIGTRFGANDEIARGRSVGFTFYDFAYQWVADFPFFYRRSWWNSPRPVKSSKRLHRSHSWSWMSWVGAHQRMMV